MNEKMNAVGYVKLVSKEPIQKAEPSLDELFQNHLTLDIATVGGFTVKTPNGNDVMFDWVAYKGYENTTKHGHVELEFNLNEFDHEYFNTSNENPPEDWTELLNGDIGEIYYEAGILDKTTNEENKIPMIVAEFGIGLFENGAAEPVWHYFTQEKIDAYNKNVELEQAEQAKKMNAAEAAANKPA